MKVKVKIFVPKYDLQGEEIEVDVDKFKSKEDWEKEKQKLLSDFQTKFKAGFKKGIKGANGRKISGYSFDDFGKGTTKNGTFFDRGAGLRNAIKKAVMNRNVKIQNEDQVTMNIFEEKAKALPTPRRAWTPKEEKFLRENKDRFTYKFIGQTLMRTPSSVGSKVSRLKRKGEL